MFRSQLLKLRSHRPVASCLKHAPLLSRSFSAAPTKPVIAIAGITGAVGQELLELIQERGFEFSEIRPLASKRSAGKNFDFLGKTYTIQELREDSFDGVDISFFSAGGSISKKFGPIAGRAKSNGLFHAQNIVIDNSSAFRMTPDVPLIVPEVNPHHLDWLNDPNKDTQNIIANPNCSTILMNLAVYPLHKKVGVSRVVCSTYQAASGAGAEAMKELETQAKEHATGVSAEKLTQDIFGRQYIFNLFSHNSAISPETGYNEEEMKMVNETRKIFEDPEINVSATCIRVPVLRAHCESINLSFKGELGEDEAREVLRNASGVDVIDDRQNNIFPEPIKASGKDDVFVGRIREDISQPKRKGLDIFIAGDQIRKGAALNAIQIAELLQQRRR